MTDTAHTASVRELSLEPGGSVEISIASGSLRIRGIDGDRVVVRSQDGDPLGDDVRVDATPGTIRIRDVEAGFRIGPLQVRTHRSPDLDIDLPRTAAVSLRTMSGDVEATGIGGASRWASASGDLRIATSAGPVQVETMSGDAVIDASVAIALGARTVSGDVRVRAPRMDTIDASTTSGDVRLEADLAPGARHSISSVSGDVDIATGSPVRLEAQTITGDVRATGPHTADGGRGRRTIVVGNGSVGLSVRTTSGDVRLRVLGLPGHASLVPPVAPPRPGAPVPPAAPVPPRVPTAPEAPAAATPLDPVVPIPPDPVAAASELPAPAVAPTAQAPSATPAPRPITDEDTQAWNAPESAVDRREAARLDVLRALEHGDLDVETASRRLEALEALEEAGPRFFRGWC